MITNELSSIVRAMLWGMVLAMEYDSIRIFRRILRHYYIWTMSVEDILFWINVGFTVFAVTYDANDGIVRGFLVAGFLVGAIVFRYSISIFYVKYVPRAILFILKPLKKAAQAVKILIYKEKGKDKEDS